MQLKYIKYVICICYFLLGFKANSQLHIQFNDSIVCGADRLELLLPMIENKKVALCGNQTSVLKNNVHLIDTLVSLKVNLVKLFTPEHGLRGKADAGEKIFNSFDIVSGLPIVSLYGNNKQPNAEQLKDIDIIVFDMQDVGARFYTYISTLHYLLKACALNGKKIIVLDRPNPNGFYVDGPVLDTNYRSFVGMHQVPIAHGMTIGEYAQMIIGENWIGVKKTGMLTVIPCLNYKHSDYYKIKIPPSPNLRTMNAIFLYPTTCLFEGTAVSVGRGTNAPFQNIGLPKFKKGKIKFTPQSLPGAKDPVYKNIPCNGIFINDSLVNSFLKKPKIDIELIRFFYENSNDKSKFFTEKGSFNSLAGNSELKMQIKNKYSEDKIRDSWKPGLARFKQIRKKYLLYSDYE